MKLGDKFVLTNVPPYFGYGMGHNTKDPMFIEIQITEEKINVPSIYDESDRSGRGYIALGSDGHMYCYNYPYHSCSFDINWTRWMPDNEFDKLSEKEKNDLVKNYLWFDVIGYQCPVKPVFADRFSIKICFCEKHQNLFYEGNECFYCKRNFTPKDRVVMNTLEHAFIGWVEKESDKIEYQIVWPKNDTEVTVTLSSVYQMRKPYLRKFDLFSDRFDMTMSRINAEVESGSIHSGDVTRGNMPKNIARALRKEARRRNKQQDHTCISKSVIF